MSRKSCIYASTFCPPKLSLAGDKNGYNYAAGSLNARIYQRNGQIVVEGAEGNPVYLYDVVGRLPATKLETVQEVLLDVPVSGAYHVNLGDAPARRVVVKRWPFFE